MRKKKEISVVKSHTAAALIGGAILLKAGAMTGSLILLIGGYSALIYAAQNKWRKRRK